METEYLVIYVTAKDKEEAEQISRGLLEAKLIACANIIDGIKSLYWWEGKIDTSQEALLVIKTRKTLFGQVETMVKSLHSYQTPEIIALPVSHGSPEYLAWIKSSVK